MAIDLQQVEKKEKKTGKKTPFLKKLYNSLSEISTISNKDKQFFMQNLKVMVKSGLPLDKALKTLSQQTKNKKFKKLLFNLYKDTEKGVSLTESLKKNKGIFNNLIVSMIESGEISGHLDEVLDQIYIQIKTSNELKSRIRSAMTYPIIVIIAMTGIGIGMLVFVIPKITAIFDQMNAELPFATRFLINFSDAIVNNGLITALGFIGFISLFISFIKSKKGKKIFHYVLLRIPVFGAIIKKINLAKFTRTLSSLIKTDIPIVKTFEITSETLSNYHYKKAMQESAIKLKEGVNISDALSEYEILFPPVIIQMISTGEQTGKIDEILGELASFYEDEIDRIMKSLPSIIEPILMLLLGGAVAFMALAIIMPMYNLTEQFQ
ncbi:type II secretion system F family protein [bacterium]|jgi:type IV pilus assembly protein PilC|nr:type II secretion system F family protein [bacterium]MBT4121599.1 type II secretion system F family protein [bacterium]MBT4335089.1 type II secretion system F family protein [bacterium]MBT4495619.1 type II secretion system F family protein [bacterium]MBT4764097.1 type II secretion system F family protein [bacterium]